MEFKVGDRVRYVVQRDIDNVKVGEVGIIRGISPDGDYAVDLKKAVVNIAVMVFAKVIMVGGVGEIRLNL